MSDNSPVPTFALRAAAALAVCLCAATAPAAADASPGDSVREMRASFTVRNVNQSKPACATDGKRYTIRGHLVGTRRALASPKAVTLYLHGLGFGEYFWRYRSERGGDLVAEMAKRGHVSAVIDRLGYGASDKPAGTGSCFGGQATIAHQIIGQLRSGRYHAAASPKFRRVGLVGHSAGGLITELEGSSFGDAHALGVLTYADQGASALTMRLITEAAGICAAGGQTVGGKPGYVSIGQTTADVRAGFFLSTPAAVFNRLMPIFTRNPCGDVQSLADAVAVNTATVGRIRQPVLVVQGGRDALFPPPAGRNQSKLFTSSEQVTFRSLPGTAHALTFERGRTQLQRDLSAWLRRNDL